MGRRATGRTEHLSFRLTPPHAALLRAEADRRELSIVEAVELAIEHLAGGAPPVVPVEPAAEDWETGVEQDTAARLRGQR